MIGLTTAYVLAGERLRVVVLDRGDLGQEASWAGAGILPPGNPAFAATPYDRLRAHSSEWFPGLSDELRGLTGIDNGYRRCGGLEFVGAADDEIERAWRDERIRFEPLADPDYRRIEPNLRPGLGLAYHLPDLGQLRNPRHIKALVAACGQRGVDLRPGSPVTGFDRSGGRVTAVRTPSGTLAGSAVVITTGAWSDELLAPLGFRPGIHPVRGQIAVLRGPAPVLRQVLLQGKRYLVPRDDGLILVGATEESAGFEKRTTAAAVSGLIEFARGLAPCLGDLALERSWAGLRPGTADGMPVIGRLPGFENVVVAAGHFRAGIQLSPATALVVSDLLARRPPIVPVEAFAVDRPPAPPARLAFRS